MNELPKEGQRRAKYVDGIGVFRGARSDTAWIKIRLAYDSEYGGKHHRAGTAIEIKLGRLSSWDWHQLEQKRDEYQGKADRNEPLNEPILPSFKVWAEDWLSQSEKRLRSYNIVQVHIHRHLLPTFGMLPIDKITTQEINQWIAMRLKAAAPATVRRELTTMSSILGTAVKAKLLDYNPCRDANRIGGIVGRQRFLEIPELTALLGAAAKIHSELPDLISWFVHSGMRKSEVLALTFGDIQEIQNGHTFALVQKSKSDEPRVVPCTKTMCEIINRQRLKNSGVGAIFPITSISLKRRWAATRELAKLPDITIHDLRRTHATYAVTAGIDLKTVAARIGHSSLTMLQKHYAVYVNQASLDAVAKIEDALSSTKS